MIVQPAWHWEIHIPCTKSCYLISKLYNQISHPVKMEQNHAIETNHSPAVLPRFVWGNIQFYPNPISTQMGSFTLFSGTMHFQAHFLCGITPSSLTSVRGRWNLASRQPHLEWSNMAENDPTLGEIDRIYNSSCSNVFLNKIYIYNYWFIFIFIFRINIAK